MALRSTLSSQMLLPTRARFEVLCSRLPSSGRRSIVIVRVSLPCQFETTARLAMRGAGSSESPARARFSRFSASGSRCTAPAASALRRPMEDSEAEWERNVLPTYLLRLVQDTVLHHFTHRTALRSLAILDRSFDFSFLIQLHLKMLL